MTDSTAEIEDLRQRLEKAENSIEELKEGNLYTAKMMGEGFCGLAYNMLGVYLTGEQRALYKELWSKKLETAREEISASETVESVFEIVRRFDSELVGFAKAEKVGTAEQAMDIAHSFIKKYSPVALPLKAVKEGDVWLVDIDVGALAVKIAKVRVDARTGDIVSYEIPEK